MTHGLPQASILCFFLPFLFVTFIQGGGGYYGYYLYVCYWECYVKLFYVMLLLS